MKTAGYRKREYRFTILELLVVIAIIAILASMLLPALKGAREKAGSIACIGNMRQIGMAAFSYADSSDAYMPMALGYGWDSNAHTNGWWICQLHPYIDNRIWDGTNSGTSKILVCPGSSGDEERFVINNQKTSNYLWNIYLGHYLNYDNNPPIYWPKKITRCANPAKVGLMADGNAKDGPYGQTLFFEFGTLPPAIQYLQLRHGHGSFNGLFADGHAANLRLEKLSASDLGLFGTFGRVGGYGFCWN